MKAAACAGYRCGTPAPSPLAQSDSDVGTALGPLLLVHCDRRPTAAALSVLSRSGSIRGRGHHAARALVGRRQPPREALGRRHERSCCSGLRGSWRVRSRLRARPRPPGIRRLPRRGGGGRVRHSRPPKRRGLGTSIGNQHEVVLVAVGQDAFADDVAGVVDR